MNHYSFLTFNERIKMRKLAILVMVFFLCAKSFAQDSLTVALSSTSYKNGDSLELYCQLPASQMSKLKAATLHVWIDDLKTKRRWKFRYPFVNGEVSAALQVSDAIPTGNYAINFLVQSGFYRIYGSIPDYSRKDSVINYVMQTGNKRSLIDRVSVNKNGDFVMKPMLFQDTARFIFSPAVKSKENYLAVTIRTPIDSTFEPVLSATRFIRVGDIPAAGYAAQTYEFSVEDPEASQLLPDVTVFAKTKTKAQLFEEEYTSAFFKSSEAKTFDGIDSDELAKAPSLGWFLQQKVPGLTIETDSADNEVFKWRGEICNIFIDEQLMMAGEHQTIMPREIALLKVFNPPFNYSMTTGFAGAIAIYTKRGRYGDMNLPRYSFRLRGYTGFDGVWK